jgi:hypothetical protein
VSSEQRIFTSFGAVISAKNVTTPEEMAEKFENMHFGDTLLVKFSSKIKELCSKKGCWMKLPLAENSETMVTFKDYGFFMPLDAQEKEVIVEGKAFVKLTSVKELQHYAEDAGKSKAQIVQITNPKREFSFEASGVLLSVN